VVNFLSRCVIAHIGIFSPIKALAACCTCGFFEVLRVKRNKLLVLPVSSFYLRKNKKTGWEEREKSEYAIPFVSIRVVSG
jgi:hypothetical protein